MRTPRRSPGSASARARRRRAVAHGALAAALAGAATWGCTHPAPVREPLAAEAVPAAFSPSGEAALADRWWTAFDDDALDALVAQALTDNLDLAAAWQRLHQARAIAEQAGAPLWPEVEAEAGASTQEPELRFEREEVFLGLSASYEVDLWGGIESRAEAERLRAEASLADYRTAALSLSAEVARTWYRLHEARARRDLLREQIRTNEQVLDLIRNRLGTGQIRGVDAFRQRGLIAGTRAQLADAEARIGTLEHLLAVLLGRAPQQDLDAETIPLPDVPPLPDAGVPADLVQRRPDLQRALLLLEAADREVAAAVSERYPRLTLTASLSTVDDAAENLFDEWVRTLAGGIVAPLFDAGRRRAAVDEAEALAAERLHAYGQATLTAFREVEDALVLELRQRERIARLREQTELAERTYDRLRTEYFNGVTDYVDVLLALTDLQALRRALITARGDLLDFRIALHRALAGGFVTAREETES